MRHSAGAWSGKTSEVPFNRKMHPGIWPKSGPQFPKRATNGKRIPLASSKEGRIFR